MIRRWIAQRALNAMNWFLNTASLSYAEYNQCITVMDILRSKVK